MKEKEHFYYEFCDFTFSKEDILKIIVTNYHRSITLNKNYPILVISKNDNEFEVFVKYLKNVLKEITIENINNYLPKYLHSKFNQKDLDNLKKIKLVQFNKNKNYNTEYDIVILKSITKRYLKKIVKELAYHYIKENSNYLSQNFIYILQYKNRFDKIYRIY